MGPIERFSGGATAPALLQALSEQYVVHGNAVLAAALADAATLDEYAPGTRLIEQGNADNHNPSRTCERRL